MARKDGETAGEIPLAGHGGRPSVWHLSGIAYLPLLSPPPPRSLAPVLAHSRVPVSLGLVLRLGIFSRTESLIKRARCDVKERLPLTRENHPLLRLSRLYSLVIAQRFRREEERERER